MKEREFNVKDFESFEDMVKSAIVTANKRLIEEQGNNPDDFEIRCEQDSEEETRFTVTISSAKSDD